MANERVLKTANDAFKAEDWATAARLYDQLYQENKTVKLNHLVVKCHYELAQYEIALAVMREQEQSYFEDHYHMILWAKIMLANHLNIMVRIAMVTLPDVPQEMTLLVTEYEAAVRQRPDFKQRYQTFYQLSAGDVTEQRHQFEMGKALPIAEWQTAVTHLLTDPFVKPIVRVSLLEMLTKLKVTDPVSYVWLDGTATDVVPSQLSPLDDLPVVQTTQDALQTLLADDDPITQQLYAESLRVQLSLLYPFVNRAVTAPQKWVCVLTGQISDGDDDPTTQQMIDWQGRLGEMMQEMTS
ncbi:hypothetical protein [Secundilactobacillus paracollinoides]|uniref:TPR repeat-containing protein n=1 Tax=Secundilactobacillus paracollinoides TaxID=240427 RepID=A0A1B2J0B9_9LACO|nr:hypothetical protein [Secundilactobacillus paracollinoides]ANZ61818.1 hypothetical protein AYR61_10995 [Secundilactobacillus paracollinoides]ANZ67737.1 hypothetical protein AYR63_11750 [Secundilactobacillus paracollinoides]